MTKPLKLILFDCDGTLVDSAAIIHRCMQRTFAKFSYNLPGFKETKAIIGLSLPNAIAKLLSRPIDDEIEQMVQAYKNAFIAIRQEADFIEPLYDGVQELIADLEKIDNFLLGMVTGKSRRGINAVCQMHGFHSFVTTRSADDCPSKPDPLMVIECCADTGIDAKQTYVIGDSVYDMEMAKAAGATAIGVSWGYHTEKDLKNAGADFIIHSPNELLAIIEEYEYA